MASGRLIAGAALFCGVMTPVGPAAGCGAKRTCGHMVSCSEAVHYFRECDLRRIDGDGDGIPCETLCGKTLDALERRLGVQTGRPLVPPVHECDGKRIL